MWLHYLQTYQQTWRAVKTHKTQGVIWPCNMGLYAGADPRFSKLGRDFFFFFLRMKDCHPQAAFFSALPNCHCHQWLFNRKGQNFMVLLTEERSWRLRNQWISRRFLLFYACVGTPRYCGQATWGLRPKNACLWWVRGQRRGNCIIVAKMRYIGKVFCQNFSILLSDKFFKLIKNVVRCYIMQPYQGNFIDCRGIHSILI